MRIEKKEDQVYQDSSCAGEGVEVIVGALVAASGVVAFSEAIRYWLGSKRV